jgi:hypothetical protein
MRLVGGSLALAALLFSGGCAGTGLFSSRDRLPKPIDSPVVRPNLKDSHKVKKAHHPSRYEKPSWGSDQERQFDSHARPLPHYQEQ